MTNNDEPKTDAEVYELFLDEMEPVWTSTLTKLWQAFRKMPTPDELKIYRDQLGEIPLGLLEIAMKRTIRDHRFASVPTVHDVWVALARELGNPADIDQAIQEWTDAQYRRCIYQAPIPVSVETQVPA